MYLKQTTFVGYKLFQLICIYNLCYTSCYFAREMCCLLSHQHFPSVRVQCPVYLFFCSSLISCFLSTSLRYCLSDIEMVPVAPVITGITFAVTFHLHWISIMRSLWFAIISASFLIKFLAPGFAASINKHIPCFFLSRIIISDLLLGMVLPVRTYSLHDIATLIPWTIFGLTIVEHN